MNAADRLQLSSQLLTKAKEFGADLAGITGIDCIKETPSYKAACKLDRLKPGNGEDHLEPGEAVRSQNIKSVIIIAVAHPADRPELDWWNGKKSPPGNQILIDVSRKLNKWAKNTYSCVELYDIPYHVHKGGIFLKDAAVMAGLGSIGRNNLFISPEYGPKVRLRAVAANQELAATGPLEFNPCLICEGYCMKECPRRVFDRVIYSEEEMGQKLLPGKSGNFNHSRCKAQLKKNAMDAREKNEMVLYEPTGEMVPLLKYCRNCEILCPLGK